MLPRHADVVGVGAVGVGRRGEHLRVAEGGVARLVAERREVRPVRERQTLEHRVAGKSGERVHDALVDGSLLAQLGPPGIRVVGVAATGMRVEAAAQIEQPAKLLAVEGLGLVDAGHRATYPPSTGRSTPVTFPARSEARNTAASAQSSAVIGFPSGCMVPTCSAIWSIPPSGVGMPAGGGEVREGHRRRADRVHPDAERRALDRHRFRELVHTTLGRAVHRAAPTHESGDGAGVDDRATVTLLLELDDRVLAPEEHAAEVHRDQAVEVVDGVLLEAHPEPRRRDADVVEEDVESAELLDRGGDHAGDLLVLGDVALDLDGDAARRLDLADGLLRPVAAEIGDDHLGAFLGEAQRGRAPDAGAGPGDHC